MAEIPYLTESSASLEAHEADEVVSLELLSRQQQQLLAEMRATRKELADVRTLCLLTSDHGRRVDRHLGELERRVTELKDDLELMLKAELMGSMTHLETKLEHRMNAMKEDFEAMLKTEILGSIAQFESRMERLIRPVVEEVPKLQSRVSELERKV